MDRRRVLKASIATLMLVGLGLAVIPFLHAMGPNSRAEANRVHVDVSDMVPGRYKMVDLGDQVDSELKFLVIKDYDSKLYVYWLNARRGSFYIFGSREYHGHCKDFGPENVNGALKPNGIIGCWDRFYGNQIDPQMQWTYAGKRVDGRDDILEQGTYSYEGKYIVLGRG